MCQSRAVKLIHLRVEGKQLKVNQKITAEVEELMHQHAAEFIPGYKSLDQVQREQEARQRRLDMIMERMGSESVPPATRAYAFHRDDGVAVGAVITHPQVPDYDASVAVDVDRLYKTAMAHQVVSAFFVFPDFRGMGFGAKILDELAELVVDTGARYLEGFVADETQALGFFEQTGANIMPRYAGLPSRPPANMMLYQPVGMSGQWAYRDLWHTNGLRCPDCDVVTRCTQDQQLVTLRCRTCFQPIHTNFKSVPSEGSTE